MIKTAEDRIISGIEHTDREDDTRLGNKERIFTVHATLAKKPKPGKSDEVTQVTNKDIHILFTDNGFMWEDSQEFDHIIEAKKAVNDTTLLLYITQIKQQISNMLIKNPRHPNYKSLYTFTQAYPDLKEILEDHRIQDWDNFDETIYTDPVDGLGNTIGKYSSTIQTHKKSREDSYAVYKSFHVQENSARLHINTTKRLLEDNTSLVNSSAMQQRQELHAIYQGILYQIHALIERTQTYKEGLQEMEMTATIVQSRLELYHKSLLQENPTRRSKKIQAEIKNRLPHGPEQGIAILGWINKQCADRENILCDMEQSIIDSQKKLTDIEEELVNIFPPAHEMFALIQLEEKQLGYDQARKNTQRAKTNQLQEQYIQKKNIKNTFIFLYEEEKILTDLCNGNFNASFNDFYKKIITQSTISEEEETFYTTIKKFITIYHQQQAQSIRDTSVVNTALGNITHIGRRFEVIKSKRYALYKEKYPQLAQHLETIQSYTQKIYAYQENIEQERTTHNIQKTQSNDTIREYNSLIKEALQQIKQYIEAIHVHILADTGGYISTIAQDLRTVHNDKFAIHIQENPELSGHLEAIKHYTKEMYTYKELISQERKKHHIPKNEDNETTRNYKTLIDQYKENSKTHIAAVDAYMYEPAVAVRTSEQVEKTIDQTIARRKTTIVSTQRSITNLLANPNELIIIEDIDTLNQSLLQSQISLTSILENVATQRGLVSQSSDNRYQSLLPLNAIIDTLISQYNEISKMENILNTYLPRPGYKMTDTDRSIKIKRDTLREYQYKSIELGRAIIVQLEDAMNNKDLSRNKPIQSMHQKITLFVLDNELGKHR